MTHTRRLSPRPTTYAPILVYLTRQEATTISLPLAEVEQIVGRPLPLTAWVTPAWWTSLHHRIARDIRALGWRTRLDVPHSTVRFLREETVVRTGP
jgi:hypothetical protein